LRLTIDTVFNGYVLTAPSCDVDERTKVFEYREDSELDPDPQTVARLLYEIIETIGAYGSRHDKERVRVVVEPGDKYMDEKGEGQ
jgi:hypothetical protein